MVMFVCEKKSDYEQKTVDQDGLWKKVIGELFDDFLLFFMPKLYAEIDFTKAPEFLDKELFQDVMNQKKGRRYVDRLVKVQLKSGTSQWILIHVEVQSSKETDFSNRMFQYFYRIYDGYEEKIIAIVLHTGREDIAEMKQFSYEYFGTALQYSYNNYRTEDYSNKALRQSSNVFSKVVLAAKAVHATKNEVEKRYRFKRELLRDLLQDDRYSRIKIVATLYFIDYLLQLPEEETKKLAGELSPVIRKERSLMELYNEETAPPTVKNSFAERLERGIEQGVKKGKKEVILSGVKQGLDISTLAALTGFSEEQVQRVIDESKNAE